MKKTAKGKPKKASAPKRRHLSVPSMRRADERKKARKVAKVAAPVMKKVSLFLRAETIPKAHAKAKSLHLPLTGYVAQLVEADLKKKAA